jgi:hypothetical protein
MTCPVKDGRRKVGGVTTPTPGRTVVVRVAVAGMAIRVVVQVTVADAAGRVNVGIQTVTGHGRGLRATKTEGRAGGYILFMAPKAVG